MRFIRWSSVNTKELHEDSDILPGFQKMNTLAPIGQHSFMGQTLLGKHALHGQL